MLTGDDNLDNISKILGDDLTSKSAQQSLKRNGIIKDEIIERKAIAFFLDKKHLANQFLEIQPLYYDEARNWWIWDKRNLYWKLIDEIDIMNNIADNSDANTINSKEKNEILEALKQEGRKYKPKPIKSTWLQFKDEIYDIKNGDVFKATPEYFSTNPIPYRLNPEKFMLTPKIDEIFKQWVGENNIKID